MIHKNAEIGNTKGITLIELGGGDVQISVISCKVNKYTGVEFVNDKPTPIGTKHNTVGCTTDNTQPQAILSFTSVASIEVVERALAKAKILLRNMDSRIDKALHIADVSGCFSAADIKKAYQAGAIETLTDGTGKNTPSFNDLKEIEIDAKKWLENT